MIILSKLADYGVIVAAHMASHPQRLMTAGTLAQETRLPRATVSKVLKTLAHAGVVAGSRGASGGYRLARAAAAISVAEVVAAIDGAIGIAQCSIHANACERAEFCPTRPHWRRINDVIGTALAAVSVAEMAVMPRAFGAEPAARTAERLAP
jgi:FeS assembly SUF system regulator